MIEFTFRFSFLFLAASLSLPTLARADHPEWPFTPVRRPSIPHVQHSGWVKNSVDAFVLAKLEKVGITGASAAEKLALLRRVTFDLTGLGPTKEEREAFLQDHDPHAYEKVVDRLLNSPRFGERWAQHWLDLVRYSETDGFKLDNFRPNAFRYRDYVIKAINADLPYDRFLQQQLAGDELEPTNSEAQIATGYLRLHPEETNGSNYRQIRQEILDDITENFGVAFLGMTVGCARCHDHKFDPFSQQEYFKLQAFFAPLVPRDDVTLATDAEKKAYDAQMATWAKASENTRTKIEKLFTAVRPRVFNMYVGFLDDDTQKALRCDQAERTPMQKQLAALGGKQVQRQMNRLHWRLDGDERKAYDELKKQLDELDRLKPAPLPMVMAIGDAGRDAPPTHRLANGDYKRLKELVSPAFPECLGDVPIKVAPGVDTATTGRRSALAKWLTRPDHPLTSRVIVNRLWHHYFGRGIVATPNDFGQMGGKPSHPELLDFLASELQASGWQLKAIHRLIVTSATYQQSSDDDANASNVAAEKVDPNNHLLWRQRVRRRDGESIRDTMLQASGRLNLRMFGTSSLPLLPKVLLDNKYGWYPDSNPEDRNRRSIYVYHRRNMALPIFQAFDSPDRIASCAARPTTVTAPQALVLLNGEFAAEQAQALAIRLLTKKTLPEHIVQTAFRKVLSREASADELRSSLEFLDHHTARIRQEGPIADSPMAKELPPWSSPAFAEAVADLCHGLMNSAEFLYVE